LRRLVLAIVIASFVALAAGKTDIQGIISKQFDGKINPATWMENTWDIIKDMRVWDLSFPGTHDSLTADLATHLPANSDIDTFIDMLKNDQLQEQATNFAKDAVFANELNKKLSGVAQLMKAMVDYCKVFGKFVSDTYEKLRLVGLKTSLEVANW